MKETIVVVGGGTAGAIVASRLSQDPGRDVVVYEKGPVYPSDRVPPALRFSYLSSVEEHPECPAVKHGDLMPEAIKLLTLYPAQAARNRTYIPRGEVLGGSSELNAAIWLWGVQEDYDEWAAKGNRLWAYDNVRSSFAAIESDRNFPHGAIEAAGPVIVNRSQEREWTALSRSFVAACEALGHPRVADFNGTGPEGVGALPFNIENGIRYGSATAFLTPELRNRPNLSLHGDTSVQRVIFEREKAVGVVLEANGQVFERRADAVFLCAGSIRSPQLLLLSGIGPVEDLKQHKIPIVCDLPGVGKHLQDHPCVNLFWDLTDDAPRERDSTGFQVSLRFTVDGSPFRNDAQINCVQFGFGRNSNGEFLLENQNVGMSCHLYRAESAGRLCLDPQNIGGPPILEYRYLSHRSDLERMREIVRRGFMIAAQEPLRNLLRTPHRLAQCCASLSWDDVRDDMRLDEWMLDNCCTGQHTSSTCRMGPATDRDAVVSEFGEVHGVKDLFVIDSSILPICPRANTCAPSMMAAEHIMRHRWL